MKELTSATFDQAKKGNAVIDFWAPWCGPCKILGPQFEAASEENKDVHFFKVNVDDEADIAGEFKVRSIPTMVFLKDGEVVGQAVGAMNKDQIAEQIKKFFE